MEHEGDRVTNCIGALCTVTKGMVQEPNDIEIRGHVEKPQHC